MYGYDSRLLGYPDSLTTTPADSATLTPPTSSSSVTNAANPLSIFRMNSAFAPEDHAHLSGVADANLLLEQHHHQQQQQQAAKFSVGSDSRTQTPPQKRPREGDDSDAGESESLPRNAAASATNVSGDGMGDNEVVSDKRAGRRKIKIEFIEDKSRRHITFSKRKAGIMKKAYELSTLTGTQVLLLVVSETGLVYTFTTPKLQQMVTQSEGKNLIQACLSAPDLPGDRLGMPILAESNGYITLSRHTSNAAASASAIAMAEPHEVQYRFIEERNHDSASPATAPAVNPAAASYIQYSYNHNTIAQAAAASVSAGTSPVAGSSGASYAAGMQQYQAAAVAAAAASQVPGYASYPASTTQSQHHSPIASAATQQQYAPQSQSSASISAAAAVAAASSIPGMASGLASYHHQSAYTHQPSHHHQGHYVYHQPQPHHAQYSHPVHYAAHHHSQPDASATPTNSSVNAAAVAAAVAAGSTGVSYMNTGHYWPHVTAAGLTPPQHHQHPPQPSQPTPPTLLQRAGYANGN
ncbi:transcription factor of the MADS box [Coemansia thaxteri]|nr:transcription factor of the MADS box [Coemansia thaxteri]KAJ2472336.1 transcription factor of the MADS box [Coemansia sp. RSA 2322]